MEEFKIKNWEGEIPFIYELTQEEIQKLLLKLKLKFFLRGNISLNDFYHYILKHNITIGNVFNQQIFNNIKKICPHITDETYIYMDFENFKKIEKIKFRDFVKNFNNIWYPEVDDLTIFDDYCEWVIHFFHYGDVGFVKGHELLLCNKYNLNIK